jgi:hypothetical protein
MEGYVKLSEHVKVAELIAKKNKGKLPRLRDIRQSHPALVNHMDRRPEAFAHIPREFARRPKGHARGEQVTQELQKIAADHGGILPRRIDLLKISPYLGHYLDRHPEARGNIPQTRYSKATAKRIAKQRARLEKIVVKQGGSFVLSREFQDKYPVLIMTIRRYPEAFAEFNRVRPRENYKTLEEHVAEANSLAAAHPEGKLPAVAVLKREHKSLYQSMRSNPEAYSQFEKERLRAQRTEPKDYVAIVKRLIKEHGSLPGYTWMRDNGYVNVMNTMYRVPHLFQGIVGVHN